MENFEKGVIEITKVKFLGVWEDFVKDKRDLFDLRGFWEGV